MTRKTISVTLSKDVVAELNRLHIQRSPLCRELIDNASDKEIKAYSTKRQTSVILTDMQIKRLAKLNPSNVSGFLDYSLRKYLQSEASARTIVGKKWRL